MGKTHSTTKHVFTLAHFRHVLRSGIRNGYKFISFSELAAHKRDDHLICCLRHDCDNDLTAAAAMASVERKLGVRATYFLMLRSAMYNLLSIPNAELVCRIIRNGHYIGLHFDEQRFPGMTLKQIAEYVDRERAMLHQEFRVPVDVVSFHQPSRRALANQAKIHCLNTYDRRDMAGVDYLSDSNTVWDEGCPCDLFRERRHRRLQLLIHPEWWSKEEVNLLGKWKEMLRNNFELTQRSLLTRERTYTKRQEIAFKSLKK